MCERYFLKDAWRTYAAPLLSSRKSDTGFELASNYNIAPRQEVPFIAMENGEVEIGTGDWGYIPDWAEELPRYRLFNVQSETVHKELIISKSQSGTRCLIPASGYYEWVEKPEGEEVPYCVTLPSYEPFFLAGICAKNHTLGVITCAVLTTATKDGSEIGKLAHRAPLIPRHEAYFEWLDPSVDEPAIRRLISRSRVSELRAHRVSDAVNDASANGPELIEPYTPALPSH